MPEKDSGTNRSTAGTNRNRRLRRFSRTHCVRRMIGTRRRSIVAAIIHPHMPDMPMRFLRYMSIWTILVIVFALQWHATDAIRGFTWKPADYLRWSMVEWYTLALLAPAVLRLTARFPIEPPHRLRFVPLHIVASIVFTACA